MKKSLFFTCFIVLCVFFASAQSFTLTPQSKRQIERVGGSVKLGERSIFVVNNVAQNYGLKDYGNNTYEAAVVYMGIFRNASYMAAISNLTDKDIPVECCFYSGIKLVDKTTGTVKARTQSKFGMTNKNINPSSITKIVFIRK